MEKVVVDKFIDSKEQECSLGNHSFSVPRLFELSKDLKVMEIPIAHMNIYHDFGKITMREMIGHIKSINDADLSYPIILDEDGEIMDGRHRLMKAILEDKDIIKAVRFPKNPQPCKIENK